MRVRTLTNSNKLYCLLLELFPSYWVAVYSLVSYGGMCLVLLLLDLLCLLSLGGLLFSERKWDSSGSGEKDKWGRDKRSLGRDSSQDV